MSAIRTFWSKPDSPERQSKIINNYEKFTGVKQQTDLANRFYNPYNELRDQNKKLAEKEQAMKKLKDIQ